ncbi:hypothetical protein OF83DRAFT_387278 [Amylostereum chailletii]|nr:hypothetical protein OF83DRAFT_387278 [Amylostereum chailletii]
MAESLNTAKYFIFVTQVHFCSMYAVTVWDWVTSLGRENRYIWKARWTMIKVLYLFARYWVLFVMPYALWVLCSDHSWSTCVRVYQSSIAICMWNQASVEAILLLRTWAFFNRSVVLLTTLSSMFLGVLAYQLYVIIRHMLPLPFLAVDEGPCFPMSRPGEAHILGFFVAPLVFDSIVTIVTMFRAFTLRYRVGVKNPIIQVFLSEGIFYYIVISIVNLINGIFYFQPRAVMSAIMIPLTVMMGPILACRLILDIRERSANSSTTFVASNSAPTSLFDFRRNRRAVQSQGGVVSSLHFGGAGPETVGNDIELGESPRTKTEFDDDTYVGHDVKKGGEDQDARFEAK